MEQQEEHIIWLLMCVRRALCLSNPSWVERLGERERQRTKKPIKKVLLSLSMLKGKFTQKCHHSLTFMVFQTCMTFSFVQYKRRNSVLVFFPCSYNEQELKLSNFKRTQKHYKDIIKVVYMKVIWFLCVTVHWKSDDIALPLLDHWEK